MQPSEDDVPRTALAASDRSLAQAAAQALREAAWSWDVTAGRAEYSSRFHELLGYEPGALAPTIEQWKRLLHPEDCDRVLAALALASTDPERSFSVTHRLRSASGAYGWFRLRGAASPEAPERVIGLLQPAESPRAHELRAQRSLLQHIPAGVLVVERDGSFTQANAYLREHLGSAHEQFLVARIADVPCFRSDPAMARALQDLRAGIPFSDVPVTVRTDRDGLRYLLVSGTPLPEQDGEREACVQPADTDRRAVVLLRDKTELVRRDKVLQAVAYASAQLVNAGGAERAVDDVLRTLGEATDVSRVYVFENERGDDGALLMTQRHEWAAPGVKPEIGNPALQRLPYRESGFGRLEELLTRGDAYASDVADLPEAERDFLAQQGILSILIVPVHAGGKWWGFLGFHECIAPRVWSPLEIESIRVAASLLGAAIARRRADQAERSRAVTKDVVRNMLRRLRQESANGSWLMRELGRSMGADAAAAPLEERLASFAEMGLGHLALDAQVDDRFVFAGRDMLEQARGAREPTCHLPLGFLEGALGGALGREVLGAEIACQSLGHARCQFVLMVRAGPSAAGKRAKLA